MAVAPLSIPITSPHSTLPPLLIHCSHLPFPKPTKPLLPLPIRASTTPSSHPIHIPPPKLVRSPHLDSHASRHSHLRFARKLSTLLLSKPRHFLPLSILRRCRRYLTLPNRRPLIPMILRYPSLFRLIYAPSQSPLHSSVLAVTLTPAALSLFEESSLLRARMEDSLAAKLHRLLMLSFHRRILTSKLVHLGPDFGFPADFRSKLCNRHPDRFVTVNTSYGRAVQLVSLDKSLASPLPPLRSYNDDRIMDRPRRFDFIPLRRGLNIKRCHREFLLRIRNLPEISPFDDCDLDSLSPEMAEKRACAVVREILGMTVEKRTLIDHLTHFRRDFGLPNKLRAMLVRHPEMFYVSIKGIRHSVYLTEAYNDKGKLLVQDELLMEKERMMELVREGKRMRRARRKGFDLNLGDDDLVNSEEAENEPEIEDGFEDLFEVGIGDDWEDIADDCEDEEDEVEQFWVKKAAAAGLIERVSEDGDGVEVW
ncbi:Ubiquitin carboxyl-terminal hydrolase family protein [Rhynchospora pubera]|uniref:Ubiquitin carboxyl-terminal hydrolase family protein n=1 Tax=Rhynchospora pubera TaxID=906938 RepID=A0AAV8CNX0_9POAL|nr:Ubiquitin carboxyl-terminal hydrolase family protein [Rhynchospora pubera]